MLKTFFSAHPFQEFADLQLKAIEADIAVASAADLASPAFVNTLKTKHELRPIALDLAAARDDVKEGPSGTTVVHFVIPFTGPSVLLRIRPTQMLLSIPQGDLTGARPGSDIDGHITLFYEARGADADNYKQWKASEVERLQKWIGFLNDDVTNYYGTMCRTIERCIAARLQRLRELDSFKQAIQ